MAVDRVASDAQDPSGDELGPLVGVDADPPRRAHRGLGGERPEVTDREEHETDDLHHGAIENAERLEGSGERDDRRREPEQQGKDERDATEPLR